MLTLALCAAAGAAPSALVSEVRPVRPGAVVIAPGDGEVTVRAIGIPTPVQVENAERICRVAVVSQGGHWAPEVGRGCPRPLRERAAAATEAWELELSPAPGRDRRLLEVWYTFPTHDDDATGEVGVWLRRAWDTELTVLPEWIGVLDYAVTTRVVPEFPEAALSVDTRVKQCDVDVDIGPLGKPTRVAASRCDEVFHDAAERALLGWRFRVDLASAALQSSALTAGVRFARSTDGLSGTARVLLPPAPVRKEPPPEDVTILAPVPRVQGKPLAVLEHQSYAPVEVRGVHWPEPIPGSGTRQCLVLVQASDEGRVWAWPEEPCDPDVQPAVLRAQQRWALSTTRLDPTQSHARARLLWSFEPDGRPLVRVPVDDLVSRRRDLPDGLSTYEKAQVRKRVAPELPAGAQSRQCAVDVQVDKRGKPVELAADPTCAAELVEPAMAAVAQWRWTPARVDGARVPSQARILVRFVSGG